MPTISSTIFINYKNYLSTPLSRVPYAGKILSKTLDAPVFVTILALNAAERVSRIALGIALFIPTLIVTFALHFCSQEAASTVGKFYNRQFSLFYPKSSLAISGQLGFKLVKQIFSDFFTCSCTVPPQDKPASHPAPGTSAPEELEMKPIGRLGAKDPVVEKLSDTRLPGTMSAREAYLNPPRAFVGFNSLGQTQSNPLNWFLSSSTYDAFVAAIPDESKLERDKDGGNNFLYCHPRNGCWYRISK